MAKLRLKQKEWFTLADAAKYLTDVTEGAEITEADVIQYALDAELTISVRLNRWTEHCFPYGNLYLSNNEGPSLKELSEGLQDPIRDIHFLIHRNQQYFVVLRDETNLMPGIYDIANDADSSEIISDLWIALKNGQQDTNGQTFSSPPALINESGKSVRFCKYINLIDDESRVAIRIPDYQIPPKTYFVVRKAEIDSLTEPSSKPENHEKLSTKEKKTYLKIIRTLCEDHEHLDLNQHSTTASQIIAMADTLGLSIPSKRTLETLLKEVRELED
ncbi:hypothetical protein [Marinobacter sp. W-8]|uniref:hypothetical protein n=1 Tax=Marinobacter sp. W-8 TaxID=3369658 RepID=UPI0037C73D01